MISVAHSGLVVAIHKRFPGASWQRCKAHLMRNILVYVPHKAKNTFTQQLKAIWLAPTREARLQAGRRSVPSSMSHVSPKRLAALKYERLAGLLYLSSTGCQKNIFYQCVGAPEPRNLAANQCGRNCAEPR